MRTSVSGTSTAPFFPIGCRTGQLTPEFSKCLAQQGKCRCNFAVLFGDAYLCTHPNHRDFT
jgi:hypothetical protein